MKTIIEKGTTEQGILNEALKAFEETTGICVKTLAFERQKDIKADAGLQVKPPDGKPIKFLAEIKKYLTNETVGHVAEQIRRFEQPGILITRYVTPPIAEKMKALDVPFIDTAGNAYLNFPPLFIYITGRKQTDIPKEGKPVRAFRPTGLKVVFALLCLPDLVTAPYREIAKAANVALGTVGWVMYDLKQLNFLVERGKHGRKLINKAKIFDTWIHAYARELKPKLHMGRYHATDDIWWKNADWEGTHTFLGGEIAAAHLTDYLKPGTITIYGPEKINEFLIKNRLKKDPQGKIEILKHFWCFDYLWEYKTIAPPILIYADLIATGDDRNIETARMIHEQYIDRLIRED